MVKRQFLNFLIRWITASIAMFVCMTVFGNFKDGYSVENSWVFYILSGLLFAVVNVVLKPLATIFALPLLRITLGAGAIVVNMLMVALTIWFLPQVGMDVWGVLGSCVVVSVLNFLVNKGLNSIK